MHNRFKCLSCKVNLHVKCYQFSYLLQKSSQEHTVIMACFRFCVFLILYSLVWSENRRLLVNDVDYRFHQLELRMQEKDSQIQSLMETVNRLQKSGNHLVLRDVNLFFCDYGYF